MAEDLQYSQDGFAARYIYFRKPRMITFFVEDAGKEFEYEEIFRRLFDSSIEIGGIFGTGGKQALISRFLEFGYVDNEYGTQIFYIADGDFDRFVCHETMINHPNFIYLESYNIESYYVDKKACLSFAKGLVEKKDKDVEAIIRYDWWYSDIIAQSKKLFFAYVFIEKYYPQKKSVGRCPFSFINRDTGFEDVNKWEELANELLMIDSEYMDKISKIEDEYICTYGNNYSNLICGKFLIKSLYHHMQNQTKIKFRESLFRWNLVRLFDTSKLNYIRRHIEAIVSI